MCETSHSVSMGRPLKFTVVGDGTVGKTCLLIAFTTKEFPQVYIPTVFDNYSGEHALHGKSYILNLWDTAGQEEFEKLRPLSYPGTNAFILCFALDNKVSFDNISLKWVPELKYYCQKTPIILVGTKKDVKSDSTVSGKSANELCKKVGLAYYVECSAKTLDGIDEVFNKSIMAAIGITEKSKIKINCLIL